MSREFVLNDLSVTPLCVSPVQEKTTPENVSEKRPDVCLWFCDVHHLNPVSVLIRLTIRKTI